MGGAGYHNNIDEVIPLFDIKIETTGEITEARDIDNKLLQLSRKDGITTITLPKLEQNCRDIRTIRPIEMRAVTWM